ncbi:MAG: DUF3102 domain-containing protein [Clostridium sp.]|uniref:DUF3102 domain-containing protein n=1 Tax=Clostridium sp. TaxID=1506 RepID=UPI003D6D3F39
MNEIIRPLEQIENEIDFYKNQFASNTIEIGKRLIEAKALIKHGEWGKWLEGKVELSQNTAGQFMRIASEFSNSESIKNLGTRKLFLMLEVPSEQRETFIAEPHEVNGETKTVEDMTTRELQKAIKEKKEVEQQLKSIQEETELKIKKVEAEAVEAKEQMLFVEHKYNLGKETYKDLEKKLNLKSNALEAHKIKLKEVMDKKPEVIEKEVIKEVIPADYEGIKRKLAELEGKNKLDEIEAAEYKNLKNQIELLKKQKNDFSREIKAVTELSGLVVKVEDFLKKELAPVKYSRAIQEQKNDEIVQRNLKDIVGRVQDWCSEMYLLLDNEKYIDAEVIENGK